MRRASAPVSGRLRPWRTGAVPGFRCGSQAVWSAGSRSVYPVFLRLHVEPQGRADLAEGHLRQHHDDPSPWPEDRTDRPDVLVAAAVPRHGSGRFLPVANDGPDFRGLPSNPGFCPASGAVAEADV